MPRPLESRRSAKGILGLGAILAGIILIVNDIFDQIERKDV